MRGVDKRPRKVLHLYPSSGSIKGEQSERDSLKQVPIESLSIAPFSLIVKRNDTTTNTRKSLGIKRSCLPSQFR